MDMAYTNSNALFAASDATGKGFGTVFNVDNQAGIRNPDGSFYQVGQPIANILVAEPGRHERDAAVRPVDGPAAADAVHAADGVRLVAPVDASTVVTADFVRADGRDLNSRPRINTRPVGQPARPRALAFTGLDAERASARGRRSATARASTTPLIFGLKRRMTNSIDFTATYTLADAKSQIGTAADELNANNLQDATLLYDDPKVYGPTSRTDARHQGTLAVVFMVKGFTVAPIFLFRSPLPVRPSPRRRHEPERREQRHPGEGLPVRRYRRRTAGQLKDIGACETWNCGRGAWRTQMNLRVSQRFRLVGNARIEAIAEVFNLFNAKNPTGFIADALLGTGEREPGLHAADQLRGRLPTARTARRPDRVPLHVLTIPIGQSPRGAVRPSAAPVFLTAKTSTTSTRRPPRTLTPYRMNPICGFSSGLWS